MTGEDFAAELHVRSQLGLECADHRAEPGYSELLTDEEAQRQIGRLSAALRTEHEEQLMRQAEQRAGAAAFWLLVETKVISTRPAPVFWNLKAEDRAPYVRLAQAIIAREKIAYEAGERNMAGDAEAGALTLDDVIRDRDAAEEQLKAAHQHIAQLREQVIILETRLGVRAADAAFEAVEGTLAEKSNIEVTLKPGS